MMPITIPETYGYLLVSGLAFIPWLIIYLKAPRHRMAMVVLGLGAFWIELLAEYLWWTADWWHPPTLTNTRIGIEDVLMSFTHLGMGLFAYKAFSRWDADGRFSFDRKLIWLGWLRFLRWFALSFGTTAILFYGFHWHSFYANLAGLTAGGLFVWYKRPYMLRAMVWTGFFMVAVLLGLYVPLAVLVPGYVQQHWFWGNLSGIAFWGLPIEDVVWYWMVGFFLGGGYEYLFTFSLVQKETLSKGI